MYTVYIFVHFSLWICSMCIVYCTCTYMYAFMLSTVCTLIYVYLNLHVHIHIHLLVHVHAHAHIYAHKYTCRCTRLCTCTCTQICTCTYTCTSTCMNIYTHFTPFFKLISCVSFSTALLTSVTWLYAHVQLCCTLGLYHSFLGWLRNPCPDNPRVKGGG
jgi:hypothetical protein